MTELWDDSGYEWDDPKHPSWAERMADRADMERKREKESSLFEPGAQKPLPGSTTPGSESDGDWIEGVPC